MFAEKDSEKITELANTSLAAIGDDPVIVAAEREQNSKGRTLAEIREIDDRWKNIP